MNNKTIAIIPARGGSKRLLGKNIQSLGGIPLVAHSILYAQQNSGSIDAVYVSTDDEEIKSIALEYGATVIDRPSQLSGDREPTISSLRHVLESLKEEVENIVLLQPTNPLRPIHLFQKAFDKYMELGCDSLFTVSRNHQKLGKISHDHFIPLNYKMGQRSQDMEPLYFENGLLYICKASRVLKNVIVTEGTFPFLVDHPFAAVDIDTHEDLEYAEYLFKSQNIDKP